jgi:hypothetical protein
MRSKKKLTFGHDVKEAGYRLFKLVRFILTVPFYAIKGIIYLANKEKKHTEEVHIEKVRESMGAQFKSFKVIQKLEGDYGAWEKLVLDSESKIGIIVGARGSGKTAFGMKVLENVYAKKKRACVALGFDKTTLPSWIEVVDSVDSIRNNSFVLIDEGGILFSSRKSMSNPNKLLSDLLLISRHKNLSILFIAQNSSNLDVNIIRQADYLVLKPSSLLQKDFERKIIKDIYTSVKEEFDNLKEEKGVSYIYSDAFRGFVKNELPSFWSTNLSKSFKDKK